MATYYIIVIIMATLLAFCFIDIKGYLSIFPLLVLMFVLFAYMKSNVDMGAYIGFYNGINSIRDIMITDPGFGLLMYSGRLLGLDYFSFLGYLGVLGLMFLTWTFQKSSKVPAIVLALYFIMDYSAEIIQIRAFIAETVMYILMWDIIEKERFKWLRFFILLTIGITFHSTCFFFALLLLPQILKNRKKLIMVVAIICVIVPTAVVLLRYIPIPMLRDKLQFYVAEQRSRISLTGLLYVTLFLGITVFINRTRILNRDWIWQEKLGKLLDIHIVSFIACVLLLYFSSNFYRMLRTVMVVDFIVIGNYYYQTGKLNRHLQVVMAIGVFGFFVACEVLLKQYYTVMIDNSVFTWLMKL